MTVGELIEELRKYDGDMPVILACPGFHNYTYVRLHQGLAFLDGGEWFDDDGNKDRIQSEAVIMTHCI